MTGLKRRTGGAISIGVAESGGVVDETDEVLTPSAVIVNAGVARLVLRSEVRRFKKLIESRLMVLISSCSNNLRLITSKGLVVEVSYGR